MKKSTLEKQKTHIVLWLGAATMLAFILFLTHDIIITNFLAYQICKADPQPKTYLHKTVEYPESIYWEDNIYPGFDEQDRLLMIRNYLDGIHLKTMALNSPDGRVYLYSATEKNWHKSREINANKITGNYFDTLVQETKIIASEAKIYTQKNMPQLNYSVTFNLIPLTEFQQRYLWSDEISIKDQRNAEVIGYNRRLMRRWYMILPDIGVGNRYYSPRSMCGLSSYAGFDHHLFSFYQNVSWHPAHMGINKYLFKARGN